ncbi:MULTISPECIES: ion transporter [unclassified Pedobacter]|uniref:ion transporter n=1 Tax=unclassified Pedobacter TaxID=2628915 RepID=UPI001D845880|nr:MULTISPECIES: ion transporter [unclassified Pedobacter]CAH0152666.1 Cyclic nucleotide-gated potassium channel mll3241 [Pedobacter sp. Bi36]CAH0208930.1 Cyclic nucleotide-gated potassium channel mll3241 [Pedobacter sp. Bi126]
MASDPPKDWRFKLHEVIYESNTPAGKAFDVGLLIAIFSSIIVVMLDSVIGIHKQYGKLFNIMEWIFAALFTVEYILRLVSIRKPISYVFSPLGIIDLIALLPSYLSIFFIGAQSLLVFRALRLLRVFRIFKLGHFLTEINFLTQALKNSVRKISIFLLTVLTITIILGSIMYLVEKRENGFSNIPESIYWAIVTITTVGYGDISPITPLGKFVASVVMLIGYAIIAVPTGIITHDIAVAARQKKELPESCPSCSREGHDNDALFCKYCGSSLYK